MVPRASVSVEMFKDGQVVKRAVDVHPLILPFMAAYDDVRSLCLFRLCADGCGPTRITRFSLTSCNLSRAMLEASDMPAIAQSRDCRCKDILFWPWSLSFRWHPFPMLAISPLKRWTNRQVET